MQRWTAFFWGTIWRLGSIGNAKLLSEFASLTQGEWEQGGDFSIVGDTQDEILGSGAH